MSDTVPPPGHAGGRPRRRCSRPWSCADEPLAFTDSQETTGLAKSTTSRLLRPSSAPAWSTATAGALRRRVRFRLVRRPATTREEVTGSPARPGGASATRPARPSTSACPRQRGRPGRAGRLRYLLGTQLGRRSTCPALLRAGQGLLRLRRGRAADRCAGAATPTTIAAWRAGARPRRRRAAAARSPATSSSSGWRRSPPVTAPRRGRRRPRGLRPDPRRSARLERARRRSSDPADALSALLGNGRTRKEGAA